MLISKLCSALARVTFLIDKYGWNGYKLWHYKNATKERIIKYSLRGLKHDLFLRTGTTDYLTFKQILLDDYYEYTLASPPQVILDCGANIGLTSVFFANKYPDAKIIAVEPEKNNYELLKKNTEKYSNITCLQNGIWHKNANLLVQDIGAGNYGFITTEVNYSNEQTIAAISIGDIIKNFNLDRIDILKIDIEGAEKEVFEDKNIEWIDKCGLVLIEFHDRIRDNTAHPFFSSINNFEYKLSIIGDNIACELNPNKS